MSSSLNQLEDKLGGLYKNVPNLPENGRKMLVEWAPWLALAAGVLSLWAAYALWSWAHIASGIIDYTNALCSAYAGYGCNTLAADHMSLWVWLGIAVLAAEGVLYLLAFPGLKAQKKSGWDYLYLGALINLAYAVVSLFTGYGVSSFIGSLIGSAIGFYFLYQVRSHYKGGHVSAAKEASKK